MASLTPGTLSKLLQNLGNKDFKVAGEHRSALLQVISIVPSLEDDPWRSRGYFLRVSDSLHSAYVSVSDEDVELILNDKIQLGQLIHVSRLDSFSPVPILRGLKPIPKRRPCVGNPTDLISSDFLSAKKVDVKSKSKGNLKKNVENAEVGVRRLSLSNAEVAGFESRRLSLDSARKGWGTSPRSENGGRGAKDRSKCKFSRVESLVCNKVSPHDSPNLSSISPLKNMNAIISPKHVHKPIVKNSEKSSGDDVLPSGFDKVTISSKTWPDDSVMFSNSLPPAIRRLGKETRSFRNVAFTSAVHALEEASICEGVLRCLSMYAHIRESSQNNSSGPLVEQFLDLHESMTKASKIICNYMANVKNFNSNESNDFNSQLSEPENNSASRRNASSWVQAAVQTDLSKFSLYTEGGEKGDVKSDKCHYLVIENKTPEKTDPENYSPRKKKTPINPRTSHSRQHNSIAKVTNAGREKLSEGEGSGLRHVDILLRNLFRSSRAWFLDYLKDCLNNGFGGKNRDDNASKVSVLGQLKRVNRWLDEAFQKEGDVDERIRNLRKMIYGFLLDNVDFTVPRV